METLFYSNCAKKSFSCVVFAFTSSSKREIAEGVRDRVERRSSTRNWQVVQQKHAFGIHMQLLG